MGSICVEVWIQLFKPLSSSNNWYSLKFLRKGQTLAFYVRSFAVFVVGELGRDKF